MEVNKVPFKSRKQEQWMYINKPALAKEWTRKYGSFSGKKKAKNKWEIIAGTRRKVGR